MFFRTLWMTDDTYYSGNPAGVTRYVWGIAKIVHLIPRKLTKFSYFEELLRVAGLYSGNILSSYSMRRNKQAMQERKHKNTQNRLSFSSREFFCFVVVVLLFQRLFVRVCVCVLEKMVLQKWYLYV